MEFKPHEIALIIAAVAIPLIFLVLGTIFLGIATPTEGGAMGAVGALALATARRKLNWSLAKQALNSTAKLSSFVIFEPCSPRPAISPF